MYCSKCGADVADGAAFCAACGTPMPSAVAERPSPVPPSTPGMISGPTPGYTPPASPTWQAPVARPAIAYAGFWLRFVAIIIDFIVIYFVRTIVLLPFGIHAGMRGMPGMFHGRSPQDIGELMPMIGLFMRIALIGALIQWLYFSLMESSSWQAMLGKKALGLTVTDLEGRRISFGRATGRYFAKIISTLILCIGYMMAGFTAKKQALHDMIAGTLVLRKL
jgi:uncharacterized RDD family membrane protein YckC